MKLAVFLFSLILFSSCQEVENSVVEWKGKTMGTSYMVKFTQAPDGPALPSQQEVDKILKEVNASMSTYIPTSEISKINSDSKKNKPYPISEDFNRVLSFSMNVAKKTEGIFDPTIGPLVNLWGFGPEGIRKVPSEKEISEAKKRVGFQKVAHDTKQMKVMFVEEGMKIDLSASAKGFGVDKIAEFLNKRRIENYMVEIGGEVRTRGKKNGRPWRIAIETPDPDFSKKTIQKVMPLHNLSVATSGNYRNFFLEKGKGYSHTIDFKTGKPVPGIMASVTVVSPNNCMEADGWATALMAMGAEKGIEYTKKYSIAAYFIYAPADSGDMVSPEKFQTYESIEFKRIFSNQESDTGK
jgi:thiamine biosynthesis lipoprotein